MAAAGTAFEGQKDLENSIVAGALMSTRNGISRVDKNFN
jgi:hypothetical protein